MSNEDPNIAALRAARVDMPSGYPTAGIDALIACAPDWTAVRLVQECLTAAAETAGAQQSALYVRDRSSIRCVALAPPHLESPLQGEVARDRFPWDIPSLHPSRFVMVQDASTLPLSGGTTVGDLGFLGAVHLPLNAGNRTIGALHLYWDREVTEWDDRMGALLRALGVFSLGRLLDRGAQPANSRTHS